MGVLADPGGPDLRVRSRSRSSTSEPCCTQTSTTKHPIQNVGNVMGDSPKTDLQILSDGYLGAGWLDVRVAIARCATPCPFGWAVGKRDAWPRHADNAACASRTCGRAGDDP